MKLKEKFIVVTGNYNNEELVLESIKIADEFAIGFAEFTHNLRSGCKKDNSEYNKWENISNKELLEIYKKEKQL
jgi:hypothetical protein